MSTNQSFFTSESYARGNVAYVAVQDAIDVANSAAEQAALALAQSGAAEDGLITTWFQTTPPVGTADGDLWFDTDDGNKLYRWNGLYGNVARTNYCPNPSAQYNSTNWSGLNGTLSIDSTVLHDGRSSWKIAITSISPVGDASQAAVWSGSNCPATPGQTWTCSTYIRSSSVSAITKYVAKLTWQNSSGTDLSTISSAVLTATDSNTWVRVQVSGVAPAGTARFVFKAGPYEAAEIQVADAFWVNDVVYEQGVTDNGVFFAGGLPGAAWAGTAGNSFSTFTPAWQLASDQRAADALVAAAGAQATADGKIRTFYQTTAPTMTSGQNIGDLWLDTDDGNKLYRWDGSSWLLAADGRIATQAGQITTLQGQYTGLSGLVDSKAVVYVQSTDPNPGSFGAAEKGDVWINTSTSDRLTKVWDGTVWQNVTDQKTLDVLATVNTKVTTFYQTAAPVATATGDLWVDTDDQNKLYRWSGSAWVEITDNRLLTTLTNITTIQSTLTTQQGLIDGKAVVWVQATAPTGLGLADKGDMWIDTSTTNRVSKVWDGSAWQDITDTLTLSTLATVNTKITTFYTTSPPTATATGDLWVDTDDGNKLYRWNGSSWVNIQDTAIGTAQTTANNAQAVANNALSTANGKNKVTYSNTVPGTTANTAGDIWYQFSTAGILIGFWIGQGGTAWQLSTITDTVIANLNAGKITAGFLDANRIAASTITADKMALGVLKTNPVNNPGFEENSDPTTYTNLSDPGQGNINAWRQDLIGAQSSAGVRNGSAHSGGRRGYVRISSGAVAGDKAALMTNTFAIKAGSSYRVSWSASAYGSGVVGVGTPLYVTACFGNTATTISTSNVNNQILSFDDSTGQNFTVVPYTASASTVSSTYIDYQGDLVIPGGQTDLWCSIRFHTEPTTPEQYVTIDDVACIEASVGGSAELTSAGLRLFDANGNEVVALVANRPNYFTVQDDNGLNQGGLTNEGGVFGTTLAIQGEATFNGTPFFGMYGQSKDDITDYQAPTGRDFATAPVGLLESYPQGVIGRYYASPGTFNIVATATQRYHLFTITADLLPGRSYRINVGPILCNVTAMASTDVNAICGYSVRTTTDGSEPSNSNGSVLSYNYMRPPTNGYQTIPAWQHIYDNNTASTLDFRMAVVLVVENCSVGLDSTGPQIQARITDEGPCITNTGQTINSVAGGTPPSSLKTYVKSYASNGWATYRSKNTLLRGSSSSVGDTGSHVFQGYSSASSFNGDQRGLWTFPSITADVGAGTVTKVEAYINMLHWYNSSGGTLKVQTHGYALSGWPTGAVPTMANPTNKTVSSTGGVWVTLPSSTYAGFASGSIKGFGIGPAGTTSAAWYGYAASGATLKVTYQK